MVGVHAGLPQVVIKLICLHCCLLILIYGLLVRILSLFSQFAILLDRWPSFSMLEIPFFLGTDRYTCILAQKVSTSNGQVILYAYVSESV